MKTLILTLSLFGFFQVFGQQQISSTQWQEDLVTLQETIHNEYSFLFVKTTVEEFDQEVEKLYASIPTMEEHEIIIGFTRLIASFKYGHTGVWHWASPFQFHNLPINLYQFSDGIYIQGTHKDYSKALGAKVIAVNDIPIEQALDMVKPTVNAENDQFFKAYGINSLRNLEILHAQGITKALETSVKFTLEKDGKTFKQRFQQVEPGQEIPTLRGYTFQDEHWLEARNQGELPLYLKHLDKVYYSEYMEEHNTVYVRHSRIQDNPEEPTAQFYNRVFDFIEQNDVEKLVIDVRLNGGGNNFLNKAVIQGLMKSEINEIGRLFVITGRRTFSACQNLVNEIDNYTNAIFVGEGTAENINFWGDARRITLPNSQLPVYLSYAWWQDKSPWANAEGTAAMVPVDISYAQYQNNEDPVLEAAIAFEDSNFQRDPMAYITGLYVAGDIQRMTQEIPQIVFNPKYSFVDFESEFLKSGERMFKNGRPSDIQAGIQIFTMTSQMFPNSARAHKMLGQSYLSLGDKDQAKSHLENAISLDEVGNIARQAQEILSEIW